MVARSVSRGQSNMKRTLLSALLVLTVIPHCFAQTQQKPDPASKLIEFHMALLKRVPTPSSPTAGADNEAMHQRHLAYVMSLLESGRAVIAGPIQDDPELAG